MLYRAMLPQSSLKIRESRQPEWIVCRGSKPEPYSWPEPRHTPQLGSVALHAGDTVIVSGAAGGVGSIAVQLARDAGAKVIGWPATRITSGSPITAYFLLPMVMVLRIGSALHAQRKSMPSLTPSAAGTSS
jgi:hypothetical protein